MFCFMELVDRHWPPNAVCVLQVAKAMEYVAKGTEQLVEARELQKDSQKWMCYSIICIVVVLVIIAAIIAFQVM